ncbi:MAG TPA: YhdP family protein [Casimicrobiaceae bacterium]|nr:YhdP family protein [Casimicrobiaceae bacterium]
MPSGPVPPAVAPSPLKRLVRLAAYAVAGAVALACALLLTVRHVVLPNVESQRDAIAAWIAGQLGHPVEIDAIATGWDGWNPEIVVQGLRVRDAAGVMTSPLIELPAVRGVVSWTSLLFADLRLRELVVERPRLAIRRDTSGKLQVGGLEIDPGAGMQDPGLFSEWVLRQRLIVVRDALIAWNDDLRNAPQLILDDVDFRLENRHGHHRFGLTGTPPPEVAGPLDLRGDLVQASLGDWKRGRGRVYLRLDYADMAAWSEWLPLPIEIPRGLGALRVWFDVDAGVLREAVADVELAEVRTRLASTLPALDLDHLAGRLTWVQDGPRRTLSARGLVLGGKGVAIAPTDMTVRYEQGPDGTVGSGRVTVSQLDLAALASLAAHLPLPERWRQEIGRHAPRGTLSATEFAWDGPPASPTAYRAVGTFLDLGVRAQDAMPGLTNVSGAFEATQAGGSLRLGSRNVRFELPRVFAQPLALDSVTGRVRWELDGGRVTVRFDDIAYANAHAAGTAQGWWRSTATGPGEIDMQARLARADVRHVFGYLPLTLQEGTRVWVRDSVLKGTTDEAQLVLKGDLARYPFPDGRGGTFLVTIKGRDATLDYANGWPPITGADAEVRFENQGLTVVATRGHVLGAALGRTTATIADLVPDHPVLVVEGEASGPTAEFLEVIARSPVAEWIGHFTDGTQAAGHGRLGLKLQMVLGGHDVAQVRGEYQFADNQLRLPGMPTLSRVNGRIAFTEREMTGRDIALEALGGPARIDVTTRDGAVRVAGGGTLNLAVLRNEFASPWAERIAGTTDWQLDLVARPAQATFVVESNLRGATVDLPAPLGKTAADTRSFRLERRLVGSEGRRDALVAEYGGALRAVALRTLGPGEATVDRALVTLGKAAAKGGDPGEPGIVIRGDLPSLDLDEWLALSRSVERRDMSRGGPAQAELRSIDVNVGRFVAFGRRYDDMTLGARRAQEGWRLALEARQVAGQARWDPPSARAVNGRFSAQLARLDLLGAPEVEPTAPEAPRAEGSPNPWPEVEIAAERFYGKAGMLGRLDLAGRPDGTDWRVTRFAIVNEAGRIDAEGSWRMTGRQQQSKFDVAVDVKDSPAFLARMGLPSDVRGAPTKLEGQLAWPGSPDDFEYDTLSGTFRVQSGAGQFTKMDPGMGRLLGVLSLQALPRRITLDFRDVFSEGFAFDNISGTVRIASGVMHTDNLLLAGPAAKVHLAGDVDLARETQALTVRVQPSLSSVVSTGAGAAAVALLAANPLVGAAVGAGTLLAQKIMQDPIEQMFSYEYAVRGSWSEPLVERLGTRMLPGRGTTSAQESVPR